MDGQRKQFFLNADFRHRGWLVFSLYRFLKPNLPLTYTNILLGFQKRNTQSMLQKPYMQSAESRIFHMDSPIQCQMHELLVDHNHPKSTWWKNKTSHHDVRCLYPTFMSDITVGHLCFLFASELTCFKLFRNCWYKYPHRKGYATLKILAVRKFLHTNYFGNWDIQNENDPLFIWANND